MVMTTKSSMTHRTLRALSGIVFLGCSFGYGQGIERSSKIAHSIRISSNDQDTEIRPTLVLAEHDGSQKRSYTLRHLDESASFLALHFDHFEFDPRCSMEITDAQGKQASILKGRGRHDLGTFWSHRIDHPSVVVITIECTGDGTETAKADFVVDRYLAGYDGQPPTKEERTLGLCRNDDRENAMCYELSHPAAFKATKSIVRMQAGNDVCTGWMISPGLLMTAGHCVATDEEAFNTQFGFSYASTSCDADIFDTPEIIEAVELVTHSATADYSILRMAGNPGFKYG
jgi:hypothetical protein